MNATNQDKKFSFIWKTLIIPLLQIILGIILINVPTFILRSTVQCILSALSVNNVQAIAFIIFCVRTLSVYFFYILFVKIFEKRNAEEVLITSASIKEFSSGSLLGISMITIIMALMWITGHFTITGINTSATLFQSFLYHSFFAFLQDIIYFAIIFRILEKNLGSWIAVIISAMIFGFKHLLFPGYTLWSVIAQTLEAGILFSAMFILTRKIWYILGFHLLWNYIQFGLILGFKSEGLTAFFIPEFSGSGLITGMPVGFEASVLTVIIGTLLGIYILSKSRKNGNFILPAWKR